MRENRGFTLSETVAVLVMLTVLAAILLPSFTVYLDRARQQTALANAQTAFLATQHLLGRRYREETGFDAVEDPVELVRDEAGANASPFRLEDILKIAELPAGLPVRIFVSYNGKAELTEFIWVEHFGRQTVTASWDADGWRSELSEAPEEEIAAERK